MSGRPEKRINVLYVDDNPADRDAVRRSLQADPQIRLIEARSPAELDRLLAAEPLDLVVSELSVWGWPELQILESLAEAGSHLPAIILTSRGSEDWAVAALRRGAADYISKNSPGNLERLPQRLRAVARPDDKERLTGGSANGEVAPRHRAEEDRDRVFTAAMGLLNVVGFDGYPKRWNPAWENYLGYNQGEMMASEVHKLIHPEDWKTAAETLAQLQSGQAVRGVEARIRCKDGSYKWLIWNAVPCVEQQLYFAMGLDITARKQVEEQLRESQERFQLLASATKEAVWDWDLRENRIWRNEGYCQTFGVPKDDAENVIEWWRQRIHPDDRARILAQIPAPIVDHRQQWALEYRFRRIDGTFAHVYDRGFVVFDDRSEPVRMVGSLMDISELKYTEEKLLESEDRFQLAAKAIRGAIWDWDLRKDNVWRSEGFQTLFGYSVEEIEPNFGWWEDRVHADDRARVLSQIPALNSAETQQWSNEYRFRRADGTFADVFDRGFVMFNPAGRPVRVIGSMMDISERRRTEEMAHLHRAELAHIARVSTMGEIATGVAHELNQPLTAIANYAESCARAIAAKGPDSDEKLLSWIEKIAVNTHRAGEMIRRLRSFTKKSEPRRCVIEVNELISEVIDLMEAETRLQNIRLRWEPTDPVHTTVDCIQIQQVLVNLVRNAFEATAANPPERRQLMIAVAASHETIEVSVEDQGEGIPPENRDRVFEAFFTSKPNGVGIGLAISRSIVEDHGGRLWFVPNPKQGVTFRFTLPMTGGGQDVSITDRFGRG